MSQAWFPFYMGDYLSKASHLSQGEHGAYLCLMLYYYSNRKPIPHSIRYSICRASAQQEQDNCDAALSQFFTKHTPGGDEAKAVWKHKRIDEELAKSESISKSRSLAARAKALQMHSKSSAHATQSQSHIGEVSPITPLTPTPKKPEVKKLVLPVGISKDTWAAFVAHRQRLRKPMTLHAQELIIQKLQQLADAGNDPTKCLNQSIEQGWQGVFEIKKEKIHEHNRGSASQPQGYRKPSLTETIAEQLRQFDGPETSANANGANSTE